MQRPNEQQQRLSSWAINYPSVKSAVVHFMILMINASFKPQHRMVREEVGDINILVNNAGIMIIKQVLFKIIITLYILAYIAASLSSCNAHTKKRGTKK